MELVQARPGIQVNTQEFLTRVYGWMTAGLIVTGAVAYATVNSPELFYTVAQWYLALIFLELGVVIALTSFLGRMSPTTATLGFLGYAALNGLTFSVILMIYTQESVGQAFFVTAGTFGGMSLYGMTTRQDLSAVGNLCLMGLFGLILALVVNIFLGSSSMDLIISIFGVAIFVGLTAYDSQKLTRLAETVDHRSSKGKKLSIMGALTLYLDFVNMFLFLLRLFGGSRD